MIPDQSHLLTSTHSYAHTDAPSGSGFIWMVVVISEKPKRFGVCCGQTFTVTGQTKTVVSRKHHSALPKQPSCFHFGPTADMGFIVHWSLMCCVVEPSYLSQRWLPGGSVGGTTVRVLMGGDGSRCPLICVAQGGEKATVLDTGGALELLTNSVTIKHVTLTRRTLGDEEENERGRFMKKNMKVGSSIWQRMCSSPTVRLHSRPVCQ